MPACRRVPESGVEKTRVMHPEFADHGQIGRHFGGIKRRDMHGFAADQNIERIRIQDDAPMFGMHLLPEIARRVVVDQVQVDHPGMGLCTPARQRAPFGPQIHRKAQPAVDMGLAGNQRLIRVQLHKRRVVQNRLALTKPDLVQAHSGAHQHGKRARADFRIERPAIARLDPVELDPVIGDQTGQQVQPAGRALGVGNRADGRRQRQRFHQRHHIDTTLFQNRAMGQVDLVHLELGQTFGHPRGAAGQETGPHTPGGVAKTQVQAGGLYLLGGDGVAGADLPMGDQLGNVLRGENTALAAGHHLAPVVGPPPGAARPAVGQDRGGGIWSG